MAKHISIGDPVNEAERWGFAYLAEKLPDNYIVLTNLEVLAQSGQPLEVDALVVGEFAVYIVDIKGYTGVFEAGVNDWSLDGRWVDNSLSKANYVARVLAGRIRDKLPRGVHAPWCQGMVLATGQEGRNIEIRRGYQELCVFKPSEIAAALTGKEYLTSKFDNAITDQQRDYTLEVIGKVGVMASRQNHIRDFLKTKCLGSAAGVEIWEAEYTVGEWRSDWLLKVLEASKQDDLSAYAEGTNRLRDEFYRLQQLSGISGIPSTAPLINDGEQLVLPIKRPRGVPLSVMNISALSSADSLQLLRRAMVAIQQIHRRGCTVGSITENSIFVSEEGDLEFLDIRNDVIASEDIIGLSKLMQPIAEQTGSDEITAWFGSVDENSEVEELRFILTRAITGELHTESDHIVYEVGEIVSERYRLSQILFSDQHCQAWSAKHVSGQFDCVVSFYENAQEYWPLVSEQFSRLMQLYHPSIERVFDINVMSKPDTYYICRAWAPGRSLSSAFESVEPGVLKLWFASLLTALQYLHSENILHRNVTPGNIICEQDNAVLVNLSGLPMEVHLADDLRFSDPFLTDVGWSSEGDIYSLILSFLSLIRLETRVYSPDLDSKDKLWLSDTLGDKCTEAIHKFMSERPPIGQDVNYLAYFGIDIDDDLIVELPQEFAEKWSISKGYMTFLVLDMLNDQHARSRNQWVLNALRSRHIPGNKTNRGSMSATVSRLKSAGIAEDYGKKVRLTDVFINSWLSR